LIYSGFEINEKDSNGDLRNNKNENAMMFAVNHGNICRELFMNGASLDS
jgi:hypothetical protein